MLKIHLCTFLIFAGTLCYAQSVTDSMKQYTMKDDIVVTADRLESPLRETASSVTVITSREIEQFERYIALRCSAECSWFGNI